MIKRIIELMKKSLLFKKTIEAIGVLLYTFLFCLVWFSNVFTNSEVEFEDHLVQKGANVSKEIVIIGVDENDIQYFNEDASVLAARIAVYLNENLTLKPTAISLSIPYKTISDEAKTILKDETKKGNIILPIDISVEDDTNFTIEGRINDDFKIVGITYPDVNEFNNCLIGHNTKISDENGVVRHAVFKLDGYNSMAYQTYVLYCQREGIIPVKEDEAGNSGSLIKFAKSEALCITYTAKDILSGNYDESKLNRKLVFVGYCDSSLDSGHYTSISYDEKMHTVEVDANITNAFLMNGFVTTIPYTFQIILLAGTVIALAMFISRCSRFASTFTCVLYGVLAIISTTLLYGVGFVGYTLPHIVNSILTGLLAALVSYSLRCNAQRLQLESIITTYMDSNVAKDLLANNNTSTLVRSFEQREVRSCRIAILFADIRGFTSISEKLPADQLVKMLNAYLSMMAQCVEKYGGTLDKFIGDATMAYWGAPSSDEEACYHASLAALEMQRRSKELAIQYKEELGIDISIGIGIHYGDAVIGSIGSESRTNFTAVGDTVNTASRIEAVTPGDCVYISEKVKERLGVRGNAIEAEELVILKGKKKPINLYSLKNVVVKETIQREDSSIVIPYSVLKKRYFAVAIDIIIVFAQVMFIFACVRNYGVHYLSYFTVSLTIISCIAGIVLLPFDIRRITNAHVKQENSYFVNCCLLVGLAANWQSFLAFLVNVVFKEGLAAFTNNTWPGGIIIYFVCPLLASISFFTIEERGDYKIKDIILAEMPLAAILLLSSIIATNIGIDVSNPELYNLFYGFPRVIYIIILQVLGIFGITHIDNRNRLRERLDKLNPERYQNSKLYILKDKIQHALKNVYVLNGLGIFFDLVIIVCSLSTTFKAIKAGGIHVYANPSLIGIVVSVCCVGSIFICVENMFLKQTRTKRAWSKYVTFIKGLGTSINFFTILLIAITSEGFGAFFTERWYASWPVYMLVPTIGTIMIVYETNEYSFMKCLLCTLPYNVMLILSKTAIYSQNLIEYYEYEIANFYSTSKIISIIIAEMVVCIMLYFFNIIIYKIFGRTRAENQHFYLNVCGNRSSISMAGNHDSEFGVHTNCYVFKDRDYALLFNAGSGLGNAKDLIKKCGRVDIILTNDNFENIMGFLAANDVSQQARIRVFATFDISKFSQHPYWPVNIIRADFIPIVKDTCVRLNTDYSIEFIATKNPESFISVVKGKNSFGYIPQGVELDKDVVSKVSNLGLLVTEDYMNYERYVYFAIDNNINTLLFSGYSANLKDETLQELEQKARNVFESSYYCKENKSYRIISR